MQGTCVTKAHTDWSFLTLLIVDKPGLQVRSNIARFEDPSASGASAEAGAWLEACPDDSQIIVLTGEMMARYVKL